MDLECAVASFCQPERMVKDIVGCRQHFGTCFVMGTPAFQCECPPLVYIARSEVKPPFHYHSGGLCTQPLPEPRDLCGMHAQHRINRNPEFRYHLSDTDRLVKNRSKISTT